MNRCINFINVEIDKLTDSIENAEHIRNGLMIINTVAALKLINKYFKEI